MQQQKTTQDRLMQYVQRLKVSFVVGENACVVHAKGFQVMLDQESPWMPMSLYSHFLTGSACWTLFVPKKKT